MYRALRDRDSTFSGIFIVGVRTTGIFCRPTCSAKKPAREKFFAAVKRGVDPELIVRAAANYAAHIVCSNTAERYVKQGQFWLSQECWEQYGAPEEPELLRAGMI